MVLALVPPLQMPETDDFVYYYGVKNFGQGQQLLHTWYAFISTSLAFQIYLESDYGVQGSSASERINVLPQNKPY